MWRYKPEEIVNRRQDIDTLAVASTKAKSGHKFGKSEPERKIPDKQELEGEKKSSESEVWIMGTENPDSVQREDSVSKGIFNTRQEIDTSAVVSTKAKPGQESGKGEPERKNSWQAWTSGWNTLKWLRSTNDDNWKPR